MSFLLAIDQGTTSSRAIAFDHQGQAIFAFNKEHKQHYPKAGYVEHDPTEIWDNVSEVCQRVVESPKIQGWGNIAAIGITNQRETVVAWDSINGKILYNAIVWQCRRTTEMVEALVQDGYSSLIKEKTGLVPDAYFSGTKMKWLLDNVDAVKTAFKKETLRFGTVESYLIYQMSGSHVTDVSNASRTMLFDLTQKEWSADLMEILGIPEWSLPQLIPNMVHDPEGRAWNRSGREVPILGIAGDQQSALFGQSCFNDGDNKITYGTGNFSLTNTGSSPKISENGLLTTVAWSLDSISNMTYALEGSVFITGALVQWLRDEMRFFDKASDIEKLAREARAEDDLVIVPAFVGLGAPYWNQRARGSILGITRGTGREDIALAALESIALQTYDLVTLMEEESGSKLCTIRVDGGACKNNLLMEMQSNLLNQEVVRPKNTETTALGAAFLAGLGAGMWADLDDLRMLNPPETTFKPDPNYPRERKITYWKEAVQRSLDWVRK